MQTETGNSSQLNIKKVLIIAASLDIGGAEKVARDIALYADKEQLAFDYVVFGDKIGAYEAQLEQIGCRIYHLPEPSEGYAAYLRKLCSIMRENRYHAVHAHTMFNCGWVMLAAKWMRVPVRITHSHSALQNGGGFAKSVYEKGMRLLILACSTDLVACGVAAGHRLFGKRAFEKRGNLILNGIDIQAFSFQEEKRTQIRKHLQWEHNKILGHVGHLTQVKNQVFLLELMPLILEKQPDARLLLLGEGEDRPMLEAKIRERHLEEHVILTGNVSNVADYLSAMDVFVFPSLFEGMPLSILEVQANGLPCVISDKVPKDVFLTDLIHPLSLSDEKESWVEAVLTRNRQELHGGEQQLQNSEFSAESTMKKIYQIYSKGTEHD